jgi:hypothetical protein
MERSEQHHAEVERLNALKAEAAESELNKYNEEPYKDAMDMIDENVEEDLENAPVLEDDQP